MALDCTWYNRKNISEVKVDNKWKNFGWYISLHFLKNLHKIRKMNSTYGCYYADGILSRSYLREIFFLIRISQKFVPGGQNNNKSVSAQSKDSCQTGDMPLYKPQVTHFADANMFPISNELTHWPLKELDLMLKIKFSVLFYWLVFHTYLMMISSDKCHRTLINDDKSTLG